jgi:hypothetical protein
VTETMQSKDEGRSTSGGPASTQTTPVNSLHTEPSAPLLRSAGIRSLISGITSATLATGISTALSQWGFSLGGYPATNAASFVLVVIIFVLLGTPAFVLLRRFSEELAAGVEPVVDDRPGIRIYPSYWVRMIRTWFVASLAMYFGILVIDMLFHASSGLSGGLRSKLGFQTCAFFGLFVASGFAVVDGVSSIFESIGLSRRPMGWAVTSVAGGLFLAVFWSGALAALLLPVDWAITSFGVGTIYTLTTALGLLPIACAVLAFITWVRIALHLDWYSPKRSRQWRATDITTWDLPVDSSKSGTAPNGYPYFMWREAADNRLGLSRPRFCAIMEDGDRLLFCFYNPVGNVEQGLWPKLAGLCAILIASILLIDYTAVPALFGRAPFLSFPEQMFFLEVIYIAFVTAFLTLVLMSATYIGVTLVRWSSNRFASDGWFETRPLSDLLGFDMPPAANLRVSGGNDNAPPNSFGLTAVFEGGHIWALTANAWNYTSAARYHAMLTAAFRDNRDKFTSEFQAKLKRAATVAPASEPTSNAGPHGERGWEIPETL